MDWNREKCVLVLEETLPLGLAANTAAILGITLEKKLPEAVGPDVTDGGGQAHLGIIAFPVPVLRSTAEAIGDLRQKLYDPALRDLTVVDFSDLAQGCKTYDAYIEQLGQVSAQELQYLGLAICGDKKQVNRLTGNLPLLR